jgi:hypothetical protein
VRTGRDARLQGSLLEVAWVDLVGARKGGRVCLDRGVDL